MSSKTCWAILMICSTFILLLMSWWETSRQTLDTKVAGNWVISCQLKTAIYIYSPNCCWALLSLCQSWQYLLSTIYSLHCVVSKVRSSFIFTMVESAMCHHRNCMKIFIEMTLIVDLTLLRPHQNKCLDKLFYNNMNNECIHVFVVGDSHY